jgi:hypothetical protein
VLVSSTKIKYTGVWHKRLYAMAIQTYSMHFTVPVVGALIGIVVLLFGRKLFWLCVVAMGFVAGVELGGRSLAPRSGGIIDEQRRKGEKAGNPEGERALACLAALLAPHRSLWTCSSLAPCHPRPNRSRATWPGISTGS